MEPIETHGPIEIYHDQDAESPRDWDNLGTLAILGYGGDEEPDTSKYPSDALYLPVYRYEHGGVVYATTPFSCPWDSGQTGYIYVSRPKVREEYNVKRISPQTRDKVLSVLRSEVETFSQWANGEVYGYINTETDDSCWGFFGIDHCLQEAMQ